MPLATRIKTLRQQPDAHTAIYELDPPYRFRNNRKAKYALVTSRQAESSVITCDPPPAHIPDAHLTYYIKRRVVLFCQRGRFLEHHWLLNHIGFEIGE